MATYRFCGDTGILHLSTGDIACSQFGEKVELSDEQSAALIAERAPIFSDSEFQKFGFNASELDENPSASSHHLAPADFQAKKSAVVDALVKRIIAQQAAKSVVPVAPAPKAEKPFVDVKPPQPAPKPEAPAVPDSKPTEEAK